MLWFLIGLFSASVVMLVAAYFVPPRGLSWAIGVVASLLVFDVLAIAALLLWYPR